MPALFALQAFAAIAIHAVHAFKFQALLGVVAVALAAVGLALWRVPRLGCGVQAQVLDVVELADAVVVVVAAQVHRLGASLVSGGSRLLVLQSAKLGSDPIYEGGDEGLTGWEAESRFTGHNLLILCVMKIQTSKGITSRPNLTTSPHNSK